MILNLQERTQQLKDSKANQCKSNSLKMICIVQKLFYRFNFKLSIKKSINSII